MKTDSSPAPKNRWPKRLGLAAGVVALLLVITWFVVTSSAFVTGVVLPRVGASLNAKVSAEDADLSPFSSLRLTGVRVETIGTEPLLTLKELRVRYRLRAILGGRIAVDELTLDSPVIRLVINPDGTSNADPLLRSSSEPETSETTTPDLAIHDVRLTNAQVVVTQKSADGSETTHELTGLNLSLDQLVNGAKSTVRLSAALTSRGNGAEPFSLTGALDGQLEADLSSALLPVQAKGSFKADVSEATGTLAPLRGFQAVLDTELTPTELRTLSLRLNRENDALASVSLSGPFNAEKSEGQLKLELTGLDRRLLGLVGGIVGLDFGDTALAGGADITVADGGGRVTVKGRFDAKALSVKSGDGAATPPLDAALTYGVRLEDNVATIEEFTLAPTVAGNPGGRVTVTGNYSLADGSGTITARLEGLNQDLVGPFTGGSLGGRDLVTITVNGEAAVRLATGGDVGLQADLALTDLATLAPGAANPDAPMSLTLRVELAQAGDVVELRNVILQLPPTAMATNELRLSGRLDMAKPEALSGRLDLAADALDLTPLYELLAGGPANTNTPPPPPPAAPATNKEPAALTLPIGNFALAVKIGRIHLREVTASDVLLDARATATTVALKPLSMALNGAPASVNADLDLGVKGWRYDLAAKLDRVPAGPLADSFLPDRRGQFNGELLLDATVKGAGLTGTSLKQSLTGGADFSLTNVNILVVSPKWKPVLTVVGLALRLTDIAQSPLNALHAQVRLGDGNIDLRGFTVESEAFRADAAAVIPIADVLNDSPLNDIPVKMQLRQSLARKANLLPDGTPEDAKYAPLPDFVKLKGTLGAPEADLDKATVTMLVLRSSPAGTVVNAAGGILKGGGEVVGSVLGGIFGGGGTNTTGTATNAPAGGTNAPPKGALQDLLNPFRR